MQSHNTGFSLAKNSSLESCASSAALPYRALKMMAHDKAPEGLWSRSGFVPLPSPPQLCLCEPPVALYTKPGTRDAWFSVDLVSGLFSAPRNLKPVNCPVWSPGTATGHVLVQISCVSVTRERGRCGRPGVGGLLALGWLGAAWHWAQLLPAWPAGSVISCPLLPLPSERALDTKALTMGVSQDHKRPVGFFFCYWVFCFSCSCFFFFFLMPPQYPLATNTHVQGGFCDALFSIWLAWEDLAFHSSGEDCWEESLFNLKLA